jgi:hypothetical protein
MGFLFAPKSVRPELVEGLSYLLSNAVPRKGQSFDKLRTNGVGWTGDAI